MSIQYNTKLLPEVKGLSKIPEELKARQQWVAWREGEREGKPTKVPYQPQNLNQMASSTNPHTWGTFEQALNVAKTNGFAGVGYVFSADDPFTGVDLDKCRDPETGEIEAWAREIINRLNSYTEISPSGCGVHILVKGKLPPGPRRVSNVEMYDSGRFFTMTALHLEGTLTIEARQEEVEALHRELFPVSPKDHIPQVFGTHSPAMPDEEVLSLLAYHEKFDLLWRGDWQGGGFPSHSEADLSLCAILAQHTHDPAQIDRIFRESGLMRLKWDERHGENSYGQSTIVKALSSQTPQGPIGAHHRPRPSLSNPKNAADLENEEIPEPSWNISGVLPVGLTLLAGAPKVGKSWLVLNFAIAIATGGLALRKLRAKRGRVCYIGLEDTERRMKDRIALLGAGFPPLLDIVLDMPRLDKGGIREIENYLSQNPDCILMVIDTLGRIKPKIKNPSYDADFDSLSGIQALAQKYSNLTILVVHHTRKMAAEDPIDTISGTLGLAGTADTIMVLKRQRQGVDATLHITGRDIEERSLNLKFDGGVWEITDRLAISPERQRIIDLLKDKGPLTPKEIAENLNEKDNNIRRLLSNMFRDGQVRKVLNRYQCQ